MLRSKPGFSRSCHVFENGVKTRTFWRSSQMETSARQGFPGLGAGNSGARDPLYYIRHFRAYLFLLSNRRLGTRLCSSRSDHAAPALVSSCVYPNPGACVFGCAHDPAARWTSPNPAIPESQPRNTFATRVSPYIRLIREGFPAIPGGIEILIKEGESDRGITPQRANGGALLIPIALSQEISALQPRYRLLTRAAWNNVPSRDERRIQYSDLHETAHIPN